MSMECINDGEHLQGIRFQSKRESFREKVSSPQVSEEKEWMKIIHYKIIQTSLIPLALSSSESRLIPGNPETRYHPHY